MNTIHWIEAKQLDRVTNYSTEVEIVRAGINQQIKLFYYCSFAKQRKSFNLDDNIFYLGKFRNRYIKAIEFKILVIIKALSIILKEKQVMIMVNQDLISHMLPALILNKLFKRNNRFVVDIRTTPVKPISFDRDMKKFHKQFELSIKYFDGFSFITPFMEKYIMQPYNIAYKSVNWSSGVDLELFDPMKHKRDSKNPSNVFRIFYHGGISESRGNLDLIKACEILIAQGYKIELTQIGILVDASVGEYIKEKKLEEWCKLLPAIPLAEVPQEIANCDLPVLPFPKFMGWRVSSPIKLMEYLSMGKKVLAPKMESFTDVFGEISKFVFYYDPANGSEINNISNAIKNIIINNLVDKGNYNSEAREFAYNYSWDMQASKLFNFCSSLWID